MEKMIDLRDLLKHEIIDLYSVEEQIIAALPNMIEKAGNPTLKRLLREHLSVTEKQKSRLDEVKQFLNANPAEEDSPGFFSRIFGGGNDETKCIGMEGIIKEGEKIISHDMSPEALDAAIIAAAQKVEHYEICGYGTAVAYSRELRLYEVTTLLEKSLDEEYIADNSLTNLAVGQLNVQAEFAGGEDMEDYAPLKEPKSKAAAKKKSTSSTKSASVKSSAKSKPKETKSTASRRSAPSVTKKLGNGHRESTRKSTTSSARTKSSVSKRRRTTSKRK
jgi:ferritin-like metal-binding protein YciE